MKWIQIAALLAAATFCLTTAAKAQKGQKPKLIGTHEVVSPSKTSSGRIGDREIIALVVQSKEVVVGVASNTAEAGKTAFVVASAYTIEPFVIVTDNWQLGRWKNAKWSVVGAMAGNAVALRCSPYSDMASDAIFLIAPMGIAEYTIPESDFQYSVCKRKCSKGQLNADPPRFVREYSYDAYSTALDALTGRTIAFTSSVSDVWECNGNLEGIDYEYGGHDDEPRSKQSGTSITIDVTTGEVRKGSR